MNYYNEFDPKAAAWLRELIKAKLIPEGKVDERGIQEVTAGDLNGFTQVHLFAGIGGWAHALGLARWSSDRPCGTCSCPCQPFSAAGENKGEEDERDLWPDAFRLISQSGIAVWFGEQVENAIKKHGWLDRICADLEGTGYACAAAVLPAASVGAPHIRHRLFWVADRGRPECARQVETGTGNPRTGRAPFKSSGGAGGLGHVKSRGLGTDGRASGHSGHAKQSVQGSGLGNGSSAGLPERGSNGRIQPGALGPYAGQAAECRSVDGRLSDSASPELQGIASAWNEQGNSQNHFVLCRDKDKDGRFKVRRVPSEPRFFPLADGFSGSRVALLRGAGNAICPEVAAQFIQAYDEVKG